MQMSKVDSRRHQQSKEKEQNPKSRLYRNLQFNEVNNNRLRVSENGSSAHCELVGLLPFNTTTMDILSYESALAMKLAIRHLNEGNGTLVSELEGLPNSCPISFSASFTDTRRSPSYAFSAVDKLTATSSIVFPSNSTTLFANQQIQSSQDLFSETTTTAALPCAFVGAVDSRISKTTAIVTGLRGFPQISAASTSTSLSDSSDFPLFGRTIPDDEFAAEAFIRFLHDTIGVRHVFVIFESHPFTQSILNNLRDAIINLGWAPGRDMNEEEQKAAMHLQDRILTTEILLEKSENSKKVLNESIDALKLSDYRFVIVLTSRSDTTDDLMEIAYEKGVAGDPNGSYHWWFFENLPSVLAGRKFPKDSNLAKAYNGTSNVLQTNDKTGYKYKKFRELSAELKRELYMQNVNDDGFTKGLFTPEAPFLNGSQWLPEGEDFAYTFTGFTYDATVLLGLSACRAVAEASSLFLTGTDYFETIKQTNFTGITGDILLDPDTGTRTGSSVQYTIDNWLSIDSDENDSNETNTTMFKPTVTYVYAPGGKEDWENIHPHVFAGGKTIETLGENPDLPPPEVTYKVVDTSVQIIAGVVCAIILAITLGCAIWTHQHKRSRVIRASQPFFLLLLCAGVGIMTLAIIPASLEHVIYGYPTAICNSYCALLQIGFGITFSTLFAKTYRINKIMYSAKKFRRIQLSVADTMYPVAIVLAINIILLTSMMIFRPVEQQEIVVDEDRFGRPTELGYTCSTAQARPFIFSMVAMDFILVCLALYQAFRARNLATEFAESRYIFGVLMISAIVLILVFPVMLLLDDNPNADTFIHTTAIAILNGTTIGFIFFPKMWLFYKGKEGSLVSKYNTADFSESSAELSGDQILTTKSPQQLAHESKRLRDDLSRMKKEKETLEHQNTALKHRIQELTGVDESNLRNVL